MSVSRPMRTVAYMLRLKPDEKARLEQLALENDVTLAYALREGARLYLEDLAAKHSESARRARGAL